MWNVGYHRKVLNYYSLKPKNSSLLVLSIRKYTINSIQ